MKLINALQVIESAKIELFAREAGFTACGIAPAFPLHSQYANIDRWLERGYDSGLFYMRRNREKRTDPTLLVNGAKSVIVCAVSYKNEAWDQQESPNPRISSYALGRDYHIVLKKMLHELLQRIRQEYPEVSGRCFTDSAPVLEKSWAVEAGLGWRGKNSLVLLPGAGSFVFLGEVIITAEADRYASPYTLDGCGRCTSCIEACPNGAIVSPYVIDTGRCISRLTTEKLPDEKDDSQDTHSWIFGCDICQSVCPYNLRSPLSAIPQFAMRFDPRTAGKEFWKTLDKETFDRLFGESPIARTGYDSIKARTQAFFDPPEPEKD